MGVRLFVHTWHADGYAANIVGQQAKWGPDASFTNVYVSKLCCPGRNCSQ